MPVSQRQPPIYLIHISASPRRIARWLRLRDENGQWLYLGRDFLQMRVWEHVLGGEFERVRYAIRLQELALHWRQSYLDWIAALGQKHDGLAWWASRIAERNTLIDSLYHKICYLQVGIETAAGTSGPLVVVAESRAVLWTLADQPEFLRRVNWPAGQGKAREYLLSGGRLIGASLHYLAKGLVGLLVARITRAGRSGLPLVADRPRVLVHSCIDDTYFSADGSSHDRYFTILLEEMRRRGYDVVTIPWLYDIHRTRRQAFAWFRRYPARYLIPEDFYSVADYLWAVSIVLQQISLPKGRQTFGGLDITRLVGEAGRQQSAYSGAATFVQYVRLFEKLAGAGFQADVYIDTFENMITEKPQVMAIRRHMPGLRTVGFQHFITSYPLMLCFATTPVEAALAPYPDKIVCNSPFTAELFRREGFPAEKLHIGPSLRYQHLFGFVETSPEPGTVLVGLSLEELHSAELMHKLIAAFPDDEDIRFWIKPHPMMSDHMWAVMLDGHGLPVHMIRVSGTMAEWIKRAACAVCATGTTLGFELALAGLPIILVGRETDFDLNPLAWFSEFDKPVYSPEELRAQVIKKLSLSSAEREHLQDWARRMRQVCVSPITEATLATFVQP